MPLQIPKLSFQTCKIAEGTKGVEQTLRIMARVVNETLLTKPDIRATALTIIKPVKDKDYRGEITAVYNWVKNNIRYTQDPWDKEMLQWPDYTLKLGQGDCDDHSILMASLLMSVGHECRFAVVQVARDSGNYDHVYAECKVNGDWVPVDTTNKSSGAMGWETPHIKKAVMEL